MPWGAGLGGGSSDAASTLLALNRLWGLDWPLERLLPIGLALGADVPFFLGGANAWSRGIGERLAPIETGPGVVCRRQAGGRPRDHGPSSATPEVAERAATARIAGFSEAFSSSPGEPGGRRESEPELADGFGRNDLQAAAERLCPEVERAAAAGCTSRFGNSRMTGSGSAVFARAGHGSAPSAAMPSDWPAGWSGRMCRSLRRHPLAAWAAGAKFEAKAGSVSGARHEPRSGVGESPSWLRHRILIPTCEGSNPSSPAKSR